MRILYVIHADFEMPGAIIDWAIQHNHTQVFYRPFAKDKTPEKDSFDILILMGGPQSPLEIEKYPYLHDEINLASEAIADGKYVIGFCLGAQIIGEALGAKAQKSPNKEVGFYPVTLNDEGVSDPFFKELPKVFSVMHWHNDMPGVPAGAVVLASSEGCPRQIIRFKEKVYGFQCHPEPKKGDIEAMIHHCKADLSPGLYVQSEQEILSTDFNMMNAKIIHFLDNLISK
ncbi:MAG: hypothetical protein WC222_01840 [Parachlamydiales bacterium]|jgi:GMP synthase (glutamine-hydrolysing)